MQYNTPVKWQIKIHEQAEFELFESNGKLACHEKHLPQSIKEFLCLEDGALPIDSIEKIGFGKTEGVCSDALSSSLDIKRIGPSRISIAMDRTISVLWDGFTDETDAYGHLEYCINSSDEDNHPEDLICFDYQWVDNERLLLSCTWNTTGAIDTYSKDIN